MLLVKAGDSGRNELLASTAVTFSEDQDFKGYAGNIAVTKKNHPELEFPETAKKLTERIMVEQAKLVNEAGLKASDAEFSVVISVAGYETIHGTHPKLFPPENTRRREELAKNHIVEVFATNGLKITKESIYGSGDQDFILQLAGEVDPKPHLTLFKATYDIMFLAQPSSHKPLSKWESISRYQYTNDKYQRVNRNLPKGGTYGLGFIISDLFYSKVATSATPIPCFGNECSRKEQERNEGVDFRKEMLALYPNMTAEEVTNHFNGFKNNNELGIKTLELAKKRIQPIWLHTITEKLIKEGGVQLAKAITRELPVLKKLLHEFQSDSEASDIIDIPVIGSNTVIYDVFPAIMAYVNKEGKKHGFQLKMVSKTSLEQHSYDAVVHMTARLAGAEQY
ncbi:hypothetical protein [Endozoicomonas montiporae]|nr:hypothetical protein [Endozoicomonas montiporae]